MLVYLNNEVIFKVSAFFLDGLCPQTADYSLSVCQADKTVFFKLWQGAEWTCKLTDVKWGFSQYVLKLLALDQITANHTHVGPAEGRVVSL